MSGLTALLLCDSAILVGFLAVCLFWPIDE